MLYQYNRVAAVAAGVFVATEHLHLSMTRIAMLDPFLALFCLLGTWWSFAYFLGAHERWAILGAFSLGLATGCKWSGLLTAFGCFLACLFLDRYHSLDDSWHKSQRYFCWLLLFIPVGFFLSYFHLFLADGFTLESLKTIFGQGERMVKFRYNAEEFVHGYKSYFWEWPLVFRPIWIYYEQENARVVGICSLGVWTAWWGFAVLMLQRAYAGLVQKIDLIGGALVLVWLGQWLPWAASTTGGFFYYMLPEVPIMALIVGKWFADLYKGDDFLAEGRWMAWTAAAIYLLGFILYYPFASGLEVVGDRIEPLAVELFVVQKVSEFEKRIAFGGQVDLSQKRFESSTEFFILPFGLGFVLEGLQVFVCVLGDFRLELAEDVDTGANQLHPLLVIQAG
jgi:dolichyl-phosphate-mannose--protein O-mannosyl transferase